MEGVKCVLDSAVEVDFQRPVRKALGVYNYNEQLHSISGCLILMYMPHYNFVVFSKVSYITL